MIQIQQAKISNEALFAMYASVLVNADPEEYDLTDMDRLAAAINRYYGQNFEGSVTAEQLREADIIITSEVRY